MAQKNTLLRELEESTAVGYKQVTLFVAAAGHVFDGGVRQSFLRWYSG